MAAARPPRYPSAMPRDDITGRVPADPAAPDALAEGRALLPPADARRVALWGIGLALGGSAVLSVNDMAVKALSGEYPLHQVVLIRALIGMAGLVLGLALTRGLGGLRPSLLTRRPGMHALRVLCVLLSNVTYFLGLAALPLADGVAIFYVAPLLIVALSVPLLHERVGWRRWAAVAVGLGGVAVMLRPGAGATTWPAVLVLLSALFYALMHILTRRMAPSESAFSMAFWTQGGFITLSLLMGLSVGDGQLAQGAGPSLAFLLRAWTWPPLADWPLFLATGVTVTLGGLMLAQAYRTCPPSIIAPFEYAGMPMAVLWGVVAFGTWPDALAWAGIAMIVGAGLYALWREAARK